MSITFRILLMATCWIISLCVFGSYIYSRLYARHINKALTSRPKHRMIHPRIIVCAAASVTVMCVLACFGKYEYDKLMYYYELSRLGTIYESQPIFAANAKGNWYSIEVLFWFILCAFVGWLAETVVCSVVNRRFVKRGVFNTPFCPSYAVLALIGFLTNYYLVSFDNVVNIAVFCLMMFFMTCIAETVVNLSMRGVTGVSLYGGEAYVVGAFNPLICLVKSLAVIGMVFAGEMLLSKLNFTANYSVAITSSAMAVMIIDGAITIFQIIEYRYKIRSLANQIKEYAANGIDVMKAMPIELTRQVRSFNCKLALNFPTAHAKDEELNMALEFVRKVYLCSYNANEAQRMNCK